MHRLVLRIDVLTDLSPPASAQHRVRERTLYERRSTTSSCI